MSGLPCNKRGDAVLRPERVAGYGRGLRRVLRAAAIPNRAQDSQRESQQMTVKGPH